jgi:hypothetical protein
MKTLIRAASAIFIAWFAIRAQTGAVTTSALHLTINYPSASVVSSMFGVLPKDVAIVEVTACNDTASTVLLSNGRVVQALRKSGVQALSRDAAISTLQNSEGKTWQSTLLRNSTHGMNIVNFLVISKAVSLGPALSNALPAVQALMQAIVPEFAKDVPDHQYLNFDRDALSERTQLTPLDCAAGLVFTMKSGAAPPAELEIDVPSVTIGPVAVPVATPAAAPAVK